MKTYTREEMKETVQRYIDKYCDEIWEPFLFDLQEFVAGKWWLPDDFLKYRMDDEDVMDGVFDIIYDDRYDEIVWGSKKGKSQ